MFKKIETVPVVEQKVKNNFKHVVPRVIGSRNSYITEAERQINTSTKSNDVTDNSILLEGTDLYETQMQMTSS